MGRRGRRRIQKLTSGRMEATSTPPCSRKQAQSGHQTSPRGQDNRSHRTKPEQLPRVGPRSAGWEGGGWVSSENWAVKGGSLWDRMTERRVFCLLLRTRKHEPVCRGRSQERPARTRGRRQWWREVPQEGLEEGEEGEGSTPPPTCQDRGTERRNPLFNFLSHTKVMCAHSRKHVKHRKKRKSGAGASHCPTSSERWAAGNGALREPWPAVWPEPPQRATPRMGSLGRGAGRSMVTAGHSGPHRTQLGPCGRQGAGCSQASDSKTRACLLIALQPRRQERQIWGDKEELPLTVDGLFLEMGRLFSIAAVSVPRALPASDPLNAAQKAPPTPNLGQPLTPW